MKKHTYEASDFAPSGAALDHVNESWARLQPHVREAIVNLIDGSLAARKSSRATSAALASFCENLEQASPEPEIARWLSASSIRTFAVKTMPTGVVLTGSFILLAIYVLARFGVAQVDALMLAGTLIFLVAILGAQMWCLAGQMEDERDIVNKITDSVYQVLAEHDRRLPPRE